VAALAVFAPCFFITVLAAPHYRRFAGKGRVQAFVEGVTAAAVGAIAGAVVVLARRSLVDPIAIGIALVSLVILLRVKKLPEPLLIVGAGLVGFAIKAFPR
jgi:chromate transporter